MIDHTSSPELMMEENGPSSGFFHDRRPKMATTAEEELVELLWQDGHVVMQNQTAPRSSKKTLLPPPMFHLGDAGYSFMQQVLPEKVAGDGDVGPSASAATTTELYMQEDEMESWLQCPIDDAGFYSDLLSPQPTPAASRVAEARPSAAKPPPVPPQRRAPEPEPAANFALFSRLKGKAVQPERMMDQCTVVDSSITPPIAAAARAAAGSERNGGGGGEATLTSSSGGSGASAGDRRRKGRKGDEFEGLSEDAEFDYVEEKKPARGLSSAKRTRAAEVHNLSERRRRDRINEKMKALQELIPHCNKSDKASMLDEAIEYLKTLQTTVQMMTRGYGMAPMVFPGVQHYMPPMGIGMGIGMGMGMGVAGMNMDISTSSLNRPLLPFPTVLPPATAAQGAAAHMAQRLPIPQYSVQHIPLPNQPMPATVQADPAFNFLGLQVPSPQAPIKVVDPYQQYFALHHNLSLPQQQGQAIAPPKNSSCNGTDAHLNKKPGRSFFWSEHL